MRQVSLIVNRFSNDMKKGGSLTKPLRSLDKNSKETLEMNFNWKASIELTIINFQLTIIK